MAYKFNAINKDKEKLNQANEKGKIANSFFSGGLNINMLDKTNKLIQNNTEANGIQHIKLDLINERKINNFDKISNSTLKASIRKIGLLNPILVRTTDTDKYIVISGHRRLAAYKELVSDLNVEKAKLEQANESTKKLTDEISGFLTIPAIVFTIVEDDSELLGTNAKYITKAIEEEMYQAANLEVRPISDNAIAKNIMYFYNLITQNQSYHDQLLDERNKTNKRKAKKLNKPAVVADLITKDLKFPIARTYVLRIIEMIESQNVYPAYFNISMKKINENIGIHSVYKDYKMALAIYKEIQSEEKDIKKEYLDRLEKTEEDVTNIYNEVFDIKPKKEPVTAKKKVLYDDVMAVILALKNRQITIEEAYKKIKKM